MPIGSSVAAVGGLVQRATAPTAGLPLYGRGLIGPVFQPITLFGAGVLAKYDRNGRAKWITSIEANGASVTGVAVDSSSNVIAVVNVTSSPANFYNIDRTLNKAVTTKGSDAFLVKYNSEGTLQWTALLQTNDTGSAVDQYNSVAVDSSGNIYATGIGGGSGTNLTISYNSDGTTGGSITNVSSCAHSFLVKYNASGFVQWIARQMPGTTATSSSSSGLAVAVDPTGTSIYVGGSFGSGSAIIGLSIYSASGTLFGSVGGVQGALGWLAKYDASGVVQWIARPAVVPSAVAVNNTVITSLAVDSVGDLYVGGRGGGSGSVTITVNNANGTAFGTLGSTAGDAFFVKYSPAGTVQWANTISSSSSDGINGLGLDRSNTVYAVGYGGSGGVTITASGGPSRSVVSGTYSTAILAKYTPAGAAQNIARILPAGPASTQANGYLNAVAADRVGNILVGGSVGAVNSDYATTVTDFGGATLSLAGRIALVKYNAAGAVQWIQRWEGSGSVVSSIATDSNCDIVVGGSLAPSGGAIYDCDVRVQARIPAAATVAPFTNYIIKYSSYPLPQWIARIECSIASRQEGSISADSAGNVYATFSTAGTVTTYSVTNAPQSLVTPGGSSFGSFTFGLTGILLTKYTTSGIVQWMATMRAASTSVSTPLSATDPGGNTYVMFRYSGTVTAYNASGTAFGTTIPIIATGGDIGLVKYNSSGAVQWVARLGSTSGETVSSIKTDSSGNVYIVGEFYFGDTFRAYSSNGTAFGTPLTNLGSGTGTSDVFVVKYDTAGTVQWVARIGGTGSENPTNITADSAGNVIVTGVINGTGMRAYSASGTAFGSTLPFAGGSDAFVVKYNSAGTVQWVARQSTANSDAVNCVATDSTGAVYVGGYCGAGTLTAWNASGTSGATTPNPYTNATGYIAKYSSAGVVQWLLPLSRVDRAGSAGVRELFVDSADGIYARSDTTNLMAFNGNGTFFGSPAYSESNRVAFLKLNTSGQCVWISPSRLSPASMAQDPAGNIYVFHRPS